MQYEIITVPLVENGEQMERLNRFLRGHRVVHVDKSLLPMGDSACWAFCIAYIETPSAAPFSAQGERKEKIDYKSVLGESQFKVFSQLRTYRKRIADEDAVPAYAVFTDAELAMMSQAETLTQQSILSIDGIGKKRMEKYGEMLLKLYHQESEDAARSSGQQEDVK